MAQINLIPTFKDDRGSLAVIEKFLPFEIKRVYFIYDITPDSVRGGHRHIKSIQAAVCIKGSCRFYCNNGAEERDFLLDSPEKCLILEKEDWHTMYDFSFDAVLLILSSEYYDVNDYIDEKY